jgi:hypothetical protein
MLAGQAFGGLFLVLAAVALPWVHYRLAADAHTSSVGAGRYKLALVIIGVFTVAMAVVQYVRTARWAAYANAGLGLAGLVTTIVAATTRLAHANDLTLSSGGDTAYAIGAVVALVASGVIVAAALGVGLARRLPSASAAAAQS